MNKHMDGWINIPLLFVFNKLHLINQLLSIHKSQFYIACRRKQEGNFQEQFMIQMEGKCLECVEEINVIKC